MTHPLLETKKNDGFEIVMEYVSYHEEQEIDGPWLEKRIDKALQEALLLGRKEGVELAEGVVPEEITGPQGPREEYQASADGFNSCRTRTLSALSSLKEKLTKEV